jgi:hypothetical protein
MRRSVRAALPMLFVLLVLLAARASAEVRWFRSDEMGLAIEPIPAFRADEFPWVLAVERSASAGGWVETRRLLSGADEQRRWTFVRSADGRTEEREERAGVIAARRLIGSAGELLQEELFDNGRPSGRSVYEYASGRLVRMRAFGADGSLSSTVEYLTAPSGRLREVICWTASDGSVRSASQAAGGSGTAAGGAAVSEERAREGDEWRTTRYDEAGRASEREQGDAAGLVWRQRLTYEGEGRTPVSSTTEWPGERKVISASYDAAGGEVEETTAVAGAVTERITWTRDEAGRVLVKRRTGAGGTEEVRTTWAEDGTLAREEYFARGTRVRTVIHTGPDERVEELFAEGDLFLRVTYRGDARVREEAVVDGAVVRERTFPP